MTKLETPTKKTIGTRLKELVRQQIFIPIAALLILVVSRFLRLCLSRLPA